MAFRQVPYQEFIAPVSSPKEFYENYELFLALSRKKSQEKASIQPYIYDTSNHDHVRQYCDGFCYNPEKPNDINYH